MKATDYIVEFLIDKGIKDVFGYPGGVICHFMDSVSKYKDVLSNHILYNEQAVAFAACSYSQYEYKKPSIVYVTSGPGATNLVTGIANAYYDSIPIIFFTGQFDTYGLKTYDGLRQRGFQETDIVSIVKSITKYSVRINDVNDLPQMLNKAWNSAMEGRLGPVLIDLPADVQRAELDNIEIKNNINCDYILECLSNAKRPCVLLGNGIKQANVVSEVKLFLEKWKIPAISSLPALDCLSTEHVLNMGIVGANGHRQTSFILDKCDLLLTLGSRLDLKQVGNLRKNFAPNAKVLRVDIDKNELIYKLNKEEPILADLKDLIPALLNNNRYKVKDNTNWLNLCKYIKEKLCKIDYKEPHYLINLLSKKIHEKCNYTVDVGQHQLWTAQSIVLKENQKIFMSSGHGSMGYSLPAAIGVYYASNLPVISINGDGGIQMNIQELQCINKNKLPITVVVMNNNSLGMIRQFQEANFNENYINTTEKSGYSHPNYKKIAEAYNIRYYSIKSIEDIKNINIDINFPNFIEIFLSNNTLLEPKFSRTQIFHDYEPKIDRNLFNELDCL